MVVIREDGSEVRSANCHVGAQVLASKATSTVDLQGGVSHHIIGALSVYGVTELRIV